MTTVYGGTAPTFPHQHRIAYIRPSAVRFSGPSNHLPQHQAHDAHVRRRPSVPSGVSQAVCVWIEVWRNRANPSSVCGSRCEAVQRSRSHGRTREDEGRRGCARDVLAHVGSFVHMRQGETPVLVLYPASSVLPSRWRSYLAAMTDAVHACGAEQNGEEKQGKG